MKASLKQIQIASVTNVVGGSQGSTVITGGVTAVSGASPITSTGGLTPTIGCATCITSAAALGAGQIVQGLGTQVVATTNNPSLGGGANPTALTQSFSNEGVTGTTAKALVKFSGNDTVQVVGTSDTDGAIGVCISGCSTSGSALIAIAGTVTCIFDNASTIDHYVTMSSTNAGQCHDAGTTPPSTQVIGRVSQAGTAGDRRVFLTIGQAGASVGAPFTGVTTLTNHGVVLGQGGSPIVATAAGSAGRLLVGQGSSADPSFQSVTGTGVIGVTSTGGTITVACNGCTNAFPDSTIQGCMMGGNWSNAGSATPAATTGAGFFGFNSNGNPGLWPFSASGFLRNLSVYSTSLVAGGNTRSNLVKAGRDSTIFTNILNQTTATVTDFNTMNTTDALSVNVGDNITYRIASNGVGTWVSSGFDVEFVPSSNLCIAGGGNQGAGGASGSTTFYPFFGDNQASTTSATRALMQIPWPVAGTFQRMFVYVNGAQPATGTETVTLEKNGVATALVTTIAASGPASSQWSDTTHTVSVADGDLINFAILNNASTTGASIYMVTLEFVPSSGGCTGPGTGCIGVIGSVINQTLTATNTFYSAPFSSNESNTNEDKFRHTVTRIGTTTIDNCRFFPSVASSGTNNVVATLYKNGVATAVTATIATGTTTVVNSTGSVTFALGDNYDMELKSTNATAGKINWSCKVS